jgi:hypothetical protein
LRKLSLRVFYFFYGFLMESIMSTSIASKAVLLCWMALGFIHISHAQHVNPSAHTHGLGNMTMVYQAGQLMMELETPAANLLGFEHTPHSKAEWLQVKNLREIVKTPG